jgi:hypothetical protein
VRLPGSKAQLRFEKAKSTCCYYVIPSEVEESQFLLGFCQFEGIRAKVSGETLFLNRSG